MKIKGFLLIFCMAMLVFGGTAYGEAAYAIPIGYDKIMLYKDGMACVQRDGLWGYVDISGKEAVFCQYQEAVDFNEGMAPVKKGDQWGFIDKAGKPIIPFQYESVSSFSDGLAAVEKNGLWGCIDAEGNEIIPCAYKSVNITGQYYTGVKEEGSLWAFIDRQNKTYHKTDIQDDLYNYYEISKGGFYGIINYDLEIILPAGAALPADYRSRYDNDGYTTIELNTYDDTFGPSLYWYDEAEDMAAYIRPAGSTRFIWVGDIYSYYTDHPNSMYPTYNLIDRYFSERVLAAKDDASGKLIYINNKGEQAVPGEYTFGKAFHEGLASVAKDGKWGVINKEGETVIPFAYATIAPGNGSPSEAPIGYFYEGLAPVHTEGRWGYINSDGRMAIAPQYLSAGVFSDGYAIAKDEGGYHILDLTGEKILSSEGRIDSIDANLVQVYNGPEYYLADPHTGERLSEAGYNEWDWSSLQGADNGRTFIVGKDGKYGMLYHPNVKIKYQGAAGGPESGIEFKNGRALAPLAALCDFLALAWSYDYGKDMATVTARTAAEEAAGHNKSVSFYLGSGGATVNGGEEILFAEKVSTTLNEQVYVDLETLMALLEIPCQYANGSYWIG